jgi:tripartite-type tricarboxylate transporter receptor subunit TctC
MTNRIVRGQPFPQVAQLVGLGLLMLGTSVSGVAQSWPAKPIRVIVGYAPGGVGDLNGRTYSQRLAAALNQSVLVDNRPGAAGGIGAELVARAIPDGYTLLMATAGELVVNPSAYPNLRYDPIADFSPISIASLNPIVFVANAATPFRTLADLILAAKAKPDTISYASTGNGSIQHLSMELFRMAGGAALIHVPYKGGGPAAAAVVAGETPVASVALAPALPHLRSGKLRALGLTSAKRSALAPEIPTFAEGGFPIDATIWAGLLAPARTAADIIQKLNVEMTKAGQNPEVRERLSTAGSEAMTSTPAEFSAILRADLEKYTKVVRGANIRLN